MPITNGVTFPLGNPIKKVEAYRLQLGLVVSREVRTTGLLVLRDAKKNLNTPAPGQADASVISNTGYLRNSIAMDVEGTGSFTRAIVYAGAEYGVWVEHGRRGLKSSPPDLGKDAAEAAWPPREPIAQWAKERRIGSGGSKGLGRDKKTGQFKSLGERQKGLVFLIQRKIAEHGIRPRPFLFPAYQRHRKQFVKRLAKAIQAIKV